MQPIIVKTFALSENKLRVILHEHERSHWVNEGPPLRLDLSKGKEPGPSVVVIQGANKLFSSREQMNAKYAEDYRPRRHIATATRHEPSPKAKGIVHIISAANSIELRAQLETDTTLAGYADVHEGWNDLLTWLTSEEPASAPVAAEPTAGQVVEAPAGETKTKQKGSPTLDMQIKTTAAHYGITVMKCLQPIAVGCVGCSVKSYRNYKKYDWLLSPKEFKDKTEKTIEEYWSERMPRNKW